MGNAAVMFTDTVLSHHYLCVHYPSLFVGRAGRRRPLGPFYTDTAAAVVEKGKCAVALLINTLFTRGLFSGDA